MGPVGRVLSNFGDRGDRVYLVPNQLLQLDAIFRRELWRAYWSFPRPCKLSGEKKRSVGREWVEL